MGQYELDPLWDDIVPIPQEDGKGALAQIAYSDEYAEGMIASWFLRISILMPSQLWDTSAL